MPKTPIHAPTVPDFIAPSLLAIRIENLPFVWRMAAHDRIDWQPWRG